MARKPALIIGRRRLGHFADNQTVDETQKPVEAFLAAARHANEVREAYNNREAVRSRPALEVEPA